MAFLKKINFGNGSHDIAKTIVTAKSGGVMSVAAPSGVTNEKDEQADYQYELDVNVDGTTIVKDGETTKSLKVGTVPAAQVSVDKSTAGITSTTAQAAFKELKDAIDSTGGAAKSYKIVEVASPASSTSLKEYKVQVAVGAGDFVDDTASATIVVPKDNAFVTAQLGHTGATVSQETGAITDGSGEDALLIEYVNGSGVYTLVAVPIGAFLKEAEFKDGLQVSKGEVSAKLGQGLEFGGESGENQSIKVKIDLTSEQDSQSTPADFLTVGANGIKISGIKDEIDRKIAALDVTTDAAVAGQYVAAIEETDGVVAVKTRANVSEAVLNNYAKKGSDETAVAATDTINQAFSKIEVRIDNNENTTAAALNNLNDKIDGVDTDLKAEVTRAQNAETAIDSAVGLTKAASGETRTFTPTTNYGTGSTTVVGNMQALDTKLKEVEDGLAAVQYKVSGTTLEFFGMTAHD